MQQEGKAVNRVNIENKQKGKILKKREKVNGRYGGGKAEYNQEKNGEKNQIN
jgi:hypothetical protein